MKNVFTHSLFVMVVSLMISSIAFVACEKKSGSQSVVDPTSGETYYSIVGRWVYSYQDYYGDRVTITLQINADHTGTYTEVSSEGTDGYNIRYNYDPKTCMGDMIMTVPGYSESFAMDFKVKWYGPNTLVLSTKESYSYYGENWEVMGTFERQ